MSTKVPKVRISTSWKLIMIAVAIVFDVLPILILIILAALMFFGFTDFSSCINVQSSDWTIVNKWYQAACAVDIAAAFIVGGATGMVLIVTAPTIYMFTGSVLVPILSVCVFTIWFWAFGVHVWRFKGSRPLRNLLTFLVELIPILNLLPMITIAVWFHIRESQKKDRKAVAEYQAQQQRIAAGRRRQVTATTAAAKSVRQARGRRGNSVEQPSSRTRVQPAHNTRTNTYAGVKPTNQEINRTPATPRGTASISPDARTKRYATAAQRAQQVASQDTKQATTSRTPPEVSEKQQYQNRNRAA